MISIQYTYLLGSSLFIVPWLILFFKRRDLRPSLMWMGLIAIPLGLLAEYFWWSRDWWQPQTVTGTRIGVEDVILSFVSVGVSACLYLAVMKKTFEGNKYPSPRRLVSLALLVIFCVSLFAILFLSGINSFMTTIIVFTIATIILLSRQLSLIMPALVNGVFTVILVIPIFLIMFAATPGYVEDTWITSNLLGIYPLGIPIEDIIFYFIGGAMVFSAYPYITNTRLATLH